MRPIVPRVAAVHDLSGFGRVSLTIVIPILSTMGVQVCPLPTNEKEIKEWLIALSEMGPKTVIITSVPDSAAVQFILSALWR